MTAYDLELLTGVPQGIEYDLELLTSGATPGAGIEYDLRLLTSGAALRTRYDLELLTSASSWERLGTLDPDAASFDDLTGVDGATYEYRVTSFLDSTIGSWSLAGPVVFPGVAPTPLSVPSAGVGAILTHHLTGDVLAVLIPSTPITFRESIDAHGFELASIPAYLSPEQRVAIRGADVMISTGSGPVWFGSVFDPKASSIECGGWNAYLNERYRPTDYVNSQTTDFRDSSGRPNIASSDIPIETVAGNITVKFDTSTASGKPAYGDMQFAWWYPRFTTVRFDRVATRVTFDWHRHSTDWLLEVWAVNADGSVPAGATPYVIESDAGLSGSDDINLWDWFGVYNKGFAFVFHYHGTGAINASSTCSFSNIRIYDVASSAVAGTDAGHDVYHAMVPFPDQVIYNCLNQLPAACLPVAAVVDVDDTTELDDLLFVAKTSESMRVDEMEKRTGGQAIWRASAGGPRFEFLPKPATPAYYVDATDPGVDDSGLTKAPLTDLYNEVMVSGVNRVTSHGTVSDVPYVQIVTNLASNPLSAIGRTRMGSIDLSGAVSDTVKTAITDAFFADQGAVSGTISSPKFTDLAGAEVRPCDVRCGELVRINTFEYGLVDVLMTAVDHVGDVNATLTVGPVRDFTTTLAKLTS